MAIAFSDDREDKNRNFSPRRPPWGRLTEILYLSINPDMSFSRVGTSECPSVTRNITPLVAINTLCQSVAKSYSLYSLRHITFSADFSEICFDKMLESKSKTESDGKNNRVTYLSGEKFDGVLFRRL